MAPKRKKAFKISAVADCVTPYTCPNPGCGKRFKVERYLRSHLTQSQQGCAQFLLKQLASGCSAVDVAQVDVAISPQVDVESHGGSTDESDQEMFLPVDDSGSDEDVDNTPIPTNIPYTNSELAETLLLKILGEAHAPHYLFQQILQWGQQVHKFGYDFEPTRLDRPAQIKALKRMLSQHSEVPEPITTQIALSAPQATASVHSVPVTRFDFTQSLLSLLHDPALTGDLSYLDVNTDNVFGKYQKDSTELGCVNSGSWYQTAYTTHIQDATKELLVPICFACDETTLNGMSRTSCWPLVFSTTLFSTTLRRSPHAWRPLGYIYDISNDESQAQSKAELTREAKASRLHTVLRTILESYVTVQKAGGIPNVTLRLGSATKTVTLKVPCCFIIGDVPGGDKMCGRQPAYSDKMHRLCRKCNVSGAEADNPRVRCQKIKQRPVSEWVRTDNTVRLNALNQLNVHSAWFDVDFGGCPYGIFSAACPTEGLHSLELGLITDCLRILFQEDLKPAKCARLDSMTMAIAQGWERQRGLSSGADGSMPRLLWNDGITNLSQMNAKYKVGMMFTVVIIALTDEGHEFFMDHFATEGRYQKMVYVFQLLLCYWVWLKKTHFWPRGDHRARMAAREAISIMLAELKMLWPRQQGQGWRKPKYHEQLHVPDDIERNGAPANYHTGPTEHHHLWHVKRLARTTQRRRAVLDKQLANRVCEEHIIQTAYRRMTHDYTINAVAAPAKFAPPTIPQQATRYAISFRVTAEHHLIPSSVTWPANGSTAGLQRLRDEFSPEVLQRILDQTNLPITPDRPSILIVATEYKRMGELFRAHPDYRRTGPWYDWAVFRWTKLKLSATARRQVNRSVHDSTVYYGDNPRLAKNHDYSPGRILGFLEVGNAYLVIANCCGLSHKKNSVFTTEWKLEDPQGATGVHVVNTECIVRPCLMVPKNTVLGTYNEIWARERWGDEFI